MSSSIVSRAVAGAVLGGALVAVPSAASAATDHLVIGEVYAHGGSSGASYKNKFVEVYNQTAAAVDVDGWSVQYRSAAGVAAFSGITALDDHVIPAGGTLLVGAASNNAASNPGADLPTPDVSNAGVSFSGSGGTIALVSSTTALTGAAADVLASPALVDLVGYGSSVTFEGAAAAAPSVTTSINRSAAGADTNVNSVDFSAAAPSPTACGTACIPVAPPTTTPTTTPTTSPTTLVPIKDIQGTGAASPLVGQTLTTTGVVTAVYKTGGFNAAYLQTPGTGGAIDFATHTASDGIYVYGSQFAQAVALGDTVDVTGKVSEYNGLTQIEAPTAWTPSATAGTVTPVPVTFPMTETQRESLEGMLVDATAGAYTLTNNYGTNAYGEIGLAAGTTVLPQPTNEARPRTSAYDRIVAENASRLITVDDGKSVNFTSGANREVPAPWLTATNEVRTGAAVTIDEPLVLDYRNSLWKLQPQTPFDAGQESATVSSVSTRDAAPRDVGGAVKLASFNVLNYFTTTGEDWVSSGRGTCTWYSDRAGNRVTVNSCTNNGPRGAANDTSLARQQAKIVRAINALDADVLSLEEIEDTGTLGGADRDEALKTLVAALNDAAGEQRWAPVLSPATIPANGRDVIRTAFVYQRDVVEPVGPSRILDSAAFANARAPLAQEFRPVDGDAGQDFLAVVNHFKSKGSGEGVNADQGDGQGASNKSRIGQAEALVDFVTSVESATDTDRVFLLGDFNSYAKEDPLQIIEDAGFVNVDQSLTNEETYQFDGLHGSLDHVFASPAARAGVTGADVWTINAPESIGREYSRFDNNVTPLFDGSIAFRASDHDPVLVGFDPGEAAQVPTTVAVEPPSVVWADEPFTLAVTVESDTGSPVGSVTVTSDGRALATAPVVDGRASVVVPAGSVAPGTRVVDLAFDGEGRYADSTGTATIDVRGNLALAATVSPGVYGVPTAVKVTGAPEAFGAVYVETGGRVVGTALMSNGQATVLIDATELAPGSHPLTVHFGGGSGFEPAAVAVTATIAKATATVTGKVLRAKVTPRKRAKVRVTVATPGFAENAGRVAVYRSGKLLTSAAVTNGKAVLLLPKQKRGTATLSVRYSGSATTNPATGTVRLKVR